MLSFHTSNRICVLSSSATWNLTSSFHTGLSEFSITRVLYLICVFLLSPIFTFTYGSGTPTFCVSAMLRAPHTRIYNRPIWLAFLIFLYLLQKSSMKNSCAERYTVLYYGQTNWYRYLQVVTEVFYVLCKTLITMKINSLLPHNNF